MDTEMLLLFVTLFAMMMYMVSLLRQTSESGIRATENTTAHIHAVNQDFQSFKQRVVGYARLNDRRISTLEHTVHRMAIENQNNDRNDGDVVSFVSGLVKKFIPFN